MSGSRFISGTTMTQDIFKEPVFFIDADKATGQSHRVIETAVFDEATQTYKTPGGATAQAMQARYPGLKVGEFDTVLKDKEDFYRDMGIFEIDEDTFIEALECMPPTDWIRTLGGETFKICERLTGNITTIYCRKGDRFFRFYDDIALKQDGVILRLEQGIQALEAARAAAVQPA